VYEFGHPDFVDVIAFRNHLRTHPAVAREYAMLKREIAANGIAGMDYTAAKTDFIERSLRDAFGVSGFTPA
jgi:GrpB-like predicted nucleotidyltransferase (UPF0157 family)